MTTLAIIFWISLFLLFYTYIGYGMLLYVLVRLRERFAPRPVITPIEPLPQVTLLIAAYNEQAVVAEKMVNCRAIDYPAELLQIVWVTDGSTDRTTELLADYPEVRVLFEPERRGKTAALNRALQLLHGPIVICTDANTVLNVQVVREIVRCFDDPQVGCVAGEKRVATLGGAAATEGIYWRYESLLKSWDDRLCTAVGAAGELFALRRELYRAPAEDTLLDDFLISMRIAQQGYRIAYCKEAYAMELPSADMREEGKRKVRIAAGGLQAVWRLRALLNIFRYGMLSFQYISHRVLRWTVTPLLLVALVPLNMLLLTSVYPALYTTTLLLQLFFWLAGLAGWMIARAGGKNKLFFIPYYFIFMNLNLFRGAIYLFRGRGRGGWEKARRA